jgi:UDP-N-acetyl-2-amino-2-deoxyglucuronate dehydrogenase
LAGKAAYRSLTFDGQEIEFSEGFTDLHTRVYAEVLAGFGTGIDDARPGVELVHSINRADIVATRDIHPLAASATIPVSLPQPRAA